MSCCPQCCIKAGKDHLLEKVSWTSAQCLQWVSHQPLNNCGRWRTILEYKAERWWLAQGHLVGPQETREINSDYANLISPKFLAYRLHLLSKTARTNGSPLILTNCWQKGKGLAVQALVPSENHDGLIFLMIYAASQYDIYMLRVP